MERAHCVISDTLPAYDNGRKDDWDSRLTLAEFAASPRRRRLAAGDSPAGAQAERKAKLDYLCQ